MQDRFIHGMKIPLEVLLKVANCLNLLDLVAITQVASPQTNPFPDMLSEVTLWKDAAYKHFPHFVNGLSNQIDIEEFDWRSFYVECYETSYAQETNRTLKLAFRNVRLMALASEGNIAELQAENIQLSDLDLSLDAFPSKRPLSLPVQLYELAFNNQKLADYFYHQVVIPFYEQDGAADIDKLSSLFDWAVSFNQPLEIIQAMATEIKMSFHPSIIDYERSIFLRALQIGNLPVIRYLRSLVVEDTHSRIPNNYFFQKIIEHSPLDTVKKFSASSNFSPTEYSTFILSAIENTDSKVFEFIFEKYNAGLNIALILPNLFIKSISLGNANVFNYLFNQFSKDEQVIDFLRVNLINLTVDMLDNFITDHHKINFAKSIITDEKLTFLKPSNYDLKKLGDAVLENINAPVLKNLLGVIHREYGKELELTELELTRLTEILYNGTLEGYAVIPHNYRFNTFVVREILSLSPEMLTPKKRSELLLDSLNYSFNLFKQLFRLLNTTPRSLSTFMSDELLDNISASYPAALEFIALESHLKDTQVTSVLDHCLSASDHDSCKRVIKAQLNLSSDINKDTYLLDLLRYSINHNEVAISLFLISTYPEVVTKHTREVINLINKTNFCSRYIASNQLTIDTLEFLLNAGMHPHAMEIEFEAPYFPLNIAARSRNHVFFNSLGQHGANIQQAFDSILSGPIESLKGQYDYEPHPNFKIYPEELKREIEFFIEQGIVVDAIDDHGHTILVRSLPKSNADLLLDEKNEMFHFLINKGASAVLALQCIQGNKHDAGDGRWTNIELYKFKYLLDRPLNLDVNNLDLIKTLFAYIKLTLPRKDDDYKQTFNIFNTKIKLPLQRSAVQKRLAANALLSVMLGSKDKAILDDFKEDFGSFTELGKIYHEWELIDQGSTHAARPSK